MKLKDSCIISRCVRTCSVDEFLKLRGGNEGVGELSEIEFETTGHDVDVGPLCVVQVERTVCARRETRETDPIGRTLSFNYNCICIPLEIYIHIHRG